MGKIKRTYSQALKYEVSISREGEAWHLMQTEIFKPHIPIKNGRQAASIYAREL